MRWARRFAASLALVGALHCHPAGPPAAEPSSPAAAALPPAAAPPAAPPPAAATPAAAATSERAATPEAPRREPAPASSAARSATEATPPAPASRPELPLGGRELFPAHRLIGFCGTPGAPALGRLAGDLPKHAKRIRDFGEKYARGRKALPVFELIAVVVQGGPGGDGKWRRRVPTSVVDQYLREARAAKALLLLNIQPGHSDFLTEAKHFERYLREPDVGLALDPEWQMKGKQKPGVVYGQTTGAAINAVADYLAEIVREGDLPEKALVFHQVNNHVLKDEPALAERPGVVLVKSVDGLGPKGAKIETYGALTRSMPALVRPGFKLFFDEDTRAGGKLMTPEEVLALTPEPDYVMYE